MTHPPGSPSREEVRTEPRVIDAGPDEMATDARWCTCCKRPLTRQIAWLELDQRTDTYHDFGGVPPSQSQGWFPFGMTCARKLLKRAAGLPDKQEKKE